MRDHILNKGVGPTATREIGNDCEATRRNELAAVFLSFPQTTGAEPRASAT